MPACARWRPTPSAGAVRFVEELVARVRRAGATGELIMRFDSGFWSNRTIATLERLDVGYTMGVRMVKSVVSAISAIDESAWTPIEYTCDGEAEVAECDYKGRRLIVRRTRLVGRQATLWPQWRHFAFVTDLEGDAVDVDAFHRAHARVELAIRDLKEGAGLEHVPSGHFFANAAWLVCAALAHDLIRWTAMLGELTPAEHFTVARTVRTRFFSVPGRLVSRSGIPTLRAPFEWPWAEPFLRALDPLASLPPVPLVAHIPRAAHRRRWHQALTTESTSEGLPRHAQIPGGPSTKSGDVNPSPNRPHHRIKDASVDRG